MHTVIESDRQCARDLLAGFAHTQPPVEFMLEQCANHIAAHRERAIAPFAKQVSLIEDFLWERGYCTELYISPLGFKGGESWQVELNYGDATEAFQGASVGEALAIAMVAAMKRRAAKATV